jgi:hypothetical protein
MRLAALLRARVPRLLRNAYAGRRRIADQYIVCELDGDHRASDGDPENQVQAAGNPYVHKYKFDSNLCLC